MVVVPTHEFIGSIKSTPSDFIVREIGGLPRSLCCPDESAAAKQPKAGDGEGGGVDPGEDPDGEGRRRGELYSGRDGQQHHRLRSSIIIEQSCRQSKSLCHIRSLCSDIFGTTILQKIQKDIVLFR